MKFGDDGQQQGGGAAPRVEAPPVSEELLERAEEEDEGARVLELEARVAELESELVAAREALDASERRTEIERRLTEAEAIDLETARLLTEAAVSAMDEPDVALAVEDLRRRKPFLFAVEPKGGARSRSASALSPAREHASSGSGEALRQLAEDARSSGDRRALLQYLRQRRGVC